MRKTVTVLFCDLVGSTAIGESSDPEIVRELMARYHSGVRSILERHGGAVEKFIGDAAMAVFGIPQVHEDDALRAVRAAADVRAAVSEMGLETRTGVNTGTVVAGGGETLVTGDAVNVAARLQTAAEPGEILVGETTATLVRDDVRLADRGPLNLKGKAEPVLARCLLEVLPSAPAFARSPNAPFVGRQDELHGLNAVLARAVEGPTPQLVTLVGTAGIGKSRLTREFLTRAAAQERIVVGRCLAYGEGITYWPLGEIVNQVAEGDPRDRVSAIVGGEDGDRVGDLLSSAIAGGSSGGSPEEISWAARRLFEALAEERPLIVVIDDIHWAEPPLLDLVEYVASFAAGVPLVLLCTARPELFETRPSWSNPRPEATLLSLAALAPDDATTLVGELRETSPTRRAAIVAAAEGNPLFIEQLLAMEADSDGADLQIPPTVHALLATRLDRLGAEERAVIGCASVEGRVFHRGSVAALLDPEGGTTVGAHLMSLVRKEFIRPDRAVLQGDDGFRFGHALIRDAAYESIPKRVRGELHERFADWLEGRASDDGVSTFEEIVGYHLEQASLYLSELGVPDAALSERAAGRLGAAGRRALGRGDVSGAANLLARGADLLPLGTPARTEIEVDLGEALIEGGSLRKAEELLTGAVSTSAAIGADDLNARARLGLAQVRIQTLEGSSQELIRQQIEPLAAVLDDHGDRRGAADAYRLLARLAAWAGDYESSFAYTERALAHARAVGDERREATTLALMASNALWGPEPVEEALARCWAIHDTVPNRRVRAHCLIRIGGLEGLAGRFDAARDAIRRARVVMDELGLAHVKAHSTDVAVVVEMLAGDYEAAEQAARTAYATLAEMGDVVYQTAEGLLLANALERQGRLGEATEWIDRVASLGEGAEAAEIAATRARIALRRDDLDEAERQRATIEGSPEPVVPGFPDPRLTLAEIHAHAGRVEEARGELERCLGRYEAKGIVPLINEAQSMLEHLVR